MDVSIRQAYCRGAYYLYSKTRHFIYKYFNQKAQIRVIFYAITNEEKQVQTDKVRKLDKSSTKKKQPTKEALLEKNFAEALV